jgi:uncharacterized protein GlcG (DUF336 family)
MASWFRKLISRSPQADLRREPDSTRDERLGGIQQLETRLCLGGFGAPPSFELDAPQSYDTVEIADTEIGRIGDDSIINEANAFRIDLSNHIPKATYPPTIRETASLDRPSSTDAEKSLQLLQPQLVTQISGNALSGKDTGTQHQSLENRRTPIAVTSGLSQGFGVVRPRVTPSSATAGPSGSSSFNSGIVGVRTGLVQVDTTSRVNSDQLAAYGSDTGQADSVVEGTPPENQILPWFGNDEKPIVVKYDFRTVNGFKNQMTQEQRELAVQALSAWSNATQGKLTFEQDTVAGDSQIINMGVGNLAAFGYVSGAGGTMSVGGGAMTTQPDNSPILGGVAWLDQDENWDTIIGNGNLDGTRDFFTVMAHETGHALGMDHTTLGRGIMSHAYPGELTMLGPEDVGYRSPFYSVIDVSPAHSPKYHVQPMGMGDPQLKATEIEQLLDRASAATSSENAIITIVDRAGTILGVRVEDGVTAPNDAVLSFMIDGAVSKASTAAFFSNGDPANGTATPLTSRTIRFLSQSTITQREVEANPNSADPTLLGPGFVAPIGLGGHFPPGIMHTHPVDLFAIEHTNRDSIVHPGADGVRDFSFGAGGITDIVPDGGADDVILAGRFDIDVTNPAIVPAGQEAALIAPESYGFISGRAPTQQSRGIATLPGGLPIFRDSNGDGFGDTLVGGIGVFFPGTEGYATFEQGFVPGIGQTEASRTNAAKVLESEYIAFAAIGGSIGADALSSRGAIIGNIAGVAPVSDIDLPFGRLDLVGITLEVVGPIPGTVGVTSLLQTGNSIGLGTVNGTDQPIDFGPDNIANNGDEALYRDGSAVPHGWLVTPQSSSVDPSLTAARVEQLITQGIEGASAVRAAVRLPLGNRTRMVLAVADRSGEVLGLYRMQDATIFSIDVAVAKARNTAYYADATALQAVDQVVTPGTAFSNRTFRFLAEPRFPSGVDGSTPPVFSILNHSNINTATAENISAPSAASTFTSVLGYDAFNPNTNFRDPSDIEHQNGVVFFPGSTPIYFGSQLIGGYGISGDGVDQDDVVTFIGAQGFLPPVGGITRADQTFVNGVRLPYIKFLRNPFG